MWLVAAAGRRNKEKPVRNLHLPLAARNPTEQTILVKLVSVGMSGEWEEKEGSIYGSMPQ